MAPVEEEIKQLSARLLALAGNPRDGLPEEVFLLISQLTPLVNVDLLIRDDDGRTLLTWRDDEFFGPGWHVPGGIIRFKENHGCRIREVARIELGCTVSFDENPIAINEIMAPERDVRGHFISLLYACRLVSPPTQALKSDGEMPKHGQWQWHSDCPSDLIRVHEVYRPYIGKGCESPPRSTIVGPIEHC